MRYIVNMLRTRPRSSIISISPQQSFDPPPPRALLAVRASLIFALVCGTLWTGSVACLWTNESSLVFQTRRSRVRSRVPTEGVVELKTTDGIRLEARRLIHGDGSPYWILFCPPSGGTIHGRVRHDLQSLYDAGYDVFAFDYRGFGRNPGTPSEGGLYEDALTAYRHLTGALDVPPHRIILAGRSLGSAVAVELATRVPSGGLLLISALDSVPAAASRFYFWAPVELLASQRFDSMAKAQRVTVPVVQVHSTKDWLIPIDVARARSRGVRLLSTGRMTRSSSPTRISRPVTGCPSPATTVTRFPASS
jgi:uncharacterized protein